MSKQNIYDNDTFFEGYQAIRKNERNANNLFEIPALFSLLPDLKGKTILDLGCGFGVHCRKFAEAGANHVLGIDISEKMLAVAETENSHTNITYLNLPMEDIDQLEGNFDLVISSLAFHYVKDFSDLITKIYDRLNDNGSLVFSQEHPINTCHAGGDRWTRDADGNRLHLNLAHYSVSGERESVWFVDNVKKYHRTFSEIINILISAGFTIEKMIEPLPENKILEEYPEYRDLLHKPDFLVVKAQKLKKKD
ncbi:class I SAM-dependent methyltransferase [Streptococcus sp. S784/96/1]|uniref:class I SAM-dependent methyltransferase n=1 Tax=Streptococcus sp. S784/96/1 TaxID=2653499 RepID=UPI001386FDF7|nr:class I SAM-dependent methyltransferase [Streptococcus sp. S784/96/1]